MDKSIQADSSQTTASLFVVATAALTRYEALDVDGEGILDVGIDIPSAEQVKELQKIKEDTKTVKTIVQLWKPMQEQLKRERSSSSSQMMANPALQALKRLSFSSSNATLAASAAAAATAASGAATGAATTDRARAPTTAELGATIGSMSYEEAALRHSETSGGIELKVKV
jgi:hypothetical protein